MKESYYFSHDYNAMQDPKMMVLFDRCGPAGIGIYWMVVEILHSQTDGKIIAKHFCHILSYFANHGTAPFDREMIEEVLFETELLVKTDDGMITTNRVLGHKAKRKQINTLRSEAGKAGAIARWQTDSKPIAKHSKPIANSCKRKGKERKGKEREVTHPPHVILSTTEEQQLIKNYGDRAIKEYIEKINDYISSKGLKPYKDYAAAIRQWLRRDNVKKLPPKPKALTPARR